MARKVLDLEQFELIANLEHFYLLKCLETKFPPRSLEEIADRLSLPLARAKTLLQRLQALGFIKEHPRGGWKRVAPSFDTPDHVSSAAIRSSHRNALVKAEEALQLPVELRDFSILLELGNVKRLPVLKQMIREFQDRVHEEFSKDPGDEVFQINIQVFPVLKQRNSK